ncbi:MAG: NUDIX hydrolase [Thermodesulfovibrio sp.]|nr:NUDIX hydrolase [Thermodesulfovibrio sp.]
MKQNQNSEILEIVDIYGRVIGRAERAVLHADPSLIHRVVHVLVFDSNGRLLLQKRSLNKDVAPGKWDTSVGGHINPGEDPPAAAAREMEEELGVSGCSMEFLYTYLFSNHRESELVYTFRCFYEGKIDFNQEEIDAVRLWTLAEIQDSLEKEIFSNHFEQEISNYLKIFE